MKTYFSSGSGIPSGTSGQVIVYNGSNTATAVNMSGDTTINNAGAVSIGSNKITTAMLQDDSVNASKLAADAVVNASVASGAAIAYSKLNLTNSIVSGDLANDSVIANKIAANAVTNVKIAALQGVAAGTVSAVKLVLPDASKDLSGFRNLTSTGSTQSNDFLVGTSKWKIVVDVSGS